MMVLHALQNFSIPAALEWPWCLLSSNLNIIEGGIELVLPFANLCLKITRDSCFHLPPDLSLKYAQAGDFILINFETKAPLC